MADPVLDDVPSQALSDMTDRAVRATAGPNGIPVAAAALVDSLDAPRRLLAARRTSPPALAGRWEFPGGKVAPGESWRQALDRELHEELGVRVQLGRAICGPLSDGSWPLPNGFRMAVWLARLSAGTPTASGAHDELRWVPVGQLGSLPWLAGDVPIVAAFAAGSGWSAPPADQ